MRLPRWSVPVWLFLAFLLLAVAPDRASANVTCTACLTNCDIRDAECQDNAASAYDSCRMACISSHPNDLPMQAICIDLCRGQFFNARGVCGTGWNQCVSGCARYCDGTPPPPDDPTENPSDNPDAPVQLEPKKPQETSRLNVGNPGHRDAARSLEFRLTLEQLESQGGLDIPLPEGYSEVTVEVRFSPRPSDLLGSLVKFARATGRGALDVRH